MSIAADLTPKLRLREEDAVHAKALGQRVAQPLETAGVTSAAAAKHLEISRRDMKRNLCGDRSFLATEIFALAEWLGGSWAEWVGAG